VYKFEVDSGLFDIIVPPSEFYPDFSKLSPDRVFNDSAIRVKWRTKQNYDFSYLMMYAQRRAKYYLQLEDDVVSKANFVSTIRSFIEKQPKRDWMVIEFSKLGFIGKVFKCEDLPLFVNFFLLFAHDKPIDWLYDLVMDIKICNPEKGWVKPEINLYCFKLIFKRYSF
jgi:alpha-1,3-mannosylglycoprotein beta-1,4-N-acetylglucosaminyltransferase A/B